MSVEVNYLAVLLAGVSSMVVGGIWYNKSVFGKTWMRLSGVKRMAGEGEGPAKQVWLFGSTFVASLVTAYILAHVTFLAHAYFLSGSFLSDALQTAFWLWLGFTAARFYVHDAFEDRRKKLTVLNVAQELVTVLVMALIIGALKP